MTDAILKYCAKWRDLTEITANVKDPGDRTIGGNVARPLRAGRLERRAIRKRGGGTRFLYRRRS